MRWKAHAFLNGTTKSDLERYGFRTRNCPNTITEMAEFEADLMKICKEIKFRNIRNNFLDKVKEDVKKVKQCDKIIVSADKSRNMYKMSKEDYNKFLVENVTKTYKKGNVSKVKDINKESLEIVKKLGIEDRVEKIQESEAYITVKDHKEGFRNRPLFRLINPSKTQLGKISKKILDKINV